jgi:D-alanine transaminase
MGRIAYVNGRFVPQGQAVVHIEDRGYQLADAVYEVWALFDGKLADAEGHFARLERSLGELRIPMPMSRTALTLVLKEAVRRNRVARVCSTCKSAAAWPGATTPSRQSPCGRPS